MTQALPLKEERCPTPPALPSEPALVSDPFFAASFPKTLRNVFGLDLRSLALFRINIALVFLWDLQERARDLRAHYTEDGVLPLTIPSSTAAIPLSVVPFSL